MIRAGVLMIALISAVMFKLNIEIAQSPFNNVQS